MSRCTEVLVSDNKFFRVHMHVVTGAWGVRDLVNDPNLGVFVPEFHLSVPKNGLGAILIFGYFGMDKEGYLNCLS